MSKQRKQTKKVNSEEKDMILQNKIESIDDQYLNINVNKDDPHINDYLHAWSKFNNRPSKITIYSSYKSNEFWNALDSHLVEGFYKNIVSEILPSGESVTYNHKYFIQVNENIYISFFEMDVDSDNCIINDLIVYHNSCKVNLEIVNNFLDSFRESMIDYHDVESSKFNVINFSTSTGMDVDPFDIPAIDS